MSKEWCGGHEHGGEADREQDASVIRAGRAEKIDTILKEAKTELIAQFKGTGIYHVRILSEESVESVAKNLSSQQEVEYAEPNFLYQQFK